MKTIYLIGLIVLAVLAAIAVFKAMEEIESGIPMQETDRAKAKWENVGLAVFALIMMVCGLLGSLP